MLKEQKNRVFVFGIVAILGILLATPAPAAALDIEVIYMTSCKDHQDGTPDSVPWVFEIWIELEDPGTLHHIHVTPPAGGSGPGSGPFIIDEYSSWDPWSYESPPGDYPSLGVLQAVYPTGPYTFDFHDSEHTSLRTFDLDNSGLSEPGAAVNFTYPSENGQTGIDLNPEFAWTVNSGAGDALAMWLFDPDTGDDIDENVPALMTKTSWTLGPLLPNHDYDLEVSVLNVKNPQTGPALPTMEVGGDTFAYCLMVEYLNEIEFTTSNGTEYHPADKDGNYEISMLEILAYIDEWAVSNVSMLEVLEGIDLWAAGHYSWDENEQGFKPGTQP